MPVRHVILAAAGLAGGFSVAAGSFALVVSLGIVPRIIGKSNTAAQVLCYENAIMLGGVLGNVISVFPGIRIPLGSPLLIVYGLGSGIHVGCLVMALAEIVNVFPIAFRRLKLKIGLGTVIAAMAAGKVAGGLWYFWQRMGT